MSACVRWAALGLLGALAGAPAGAVAQDLAIVGGDVHTVSGGVIRGGTVVVRAGRIAAVGTNVAVPAGVEVIQAAGLAVTPGYIDARAGIGVRPQARTDRERVIAPDVHVAQALGELSVPAAFGQQARQRAVHPWLMNGVTAAYVGPSPGNVVGGFGAVVKLTDSGLGTVLSDAAGLAVSIGDQADAGQDAPTTRQGRVAALRQWLIDEAASNAGGDIGRVLSGSIPVRVVADTPDDILTAVRVAREFDLALVVDIAAGAHEVARELAAAGAQVVVGPAMIGGSSDPEMFAHSVVNAAVLRSAGVTIALSTDAASGRSVVMEAVVARGHGLSADDALRALTLDAARILRVDDRVGSIEIGKDADLVVWDGDPVGTWGETRAVIVDGRVVYRR